MATATKNQTHVVLKQQQVQWYETVCLQEYFSSHDSMQSRLLWQKRMHKLGSGWETLGIINMYLFVWLGTGLWWQCGLITKPQPDVWMYEFRQTMCESTKSSSVNNLQAVHLVDIRDYSIRGWGDALGASERWLERPKLYSQPKIDFKSLFLKSNKTWCQQRIHSHLSICKVVAVSISKHCHA